MKWVIFFSSLLIFTIIKTILRTFFLLCLSFTSILYIERWQRCSVAGTTTLDRECQFSSCLVWKCKNQWRRKSGNNDSEIWSLNFEVWSPKSEVWSLKIPLAFRTYITNATESTHNKGIEISHCYKYYNVSNI